jgi:hypothetical protein
MSDIKTATVEVAYVNQPQAGKKEGSIKTKDGVYYGVKPTLLGLFQQGGTYEINFDTTNFKGKDYHHVQAVKPVAVASTGAASGGGNSKAVQEHIFVCGAFNNAMHGGQVDIRDELGMIEAVNRLREVYKRTFANPQKAEDMQDEVPY